jgi:hypothetical protein
MWLFKTAVIVVFCIELLILGFTAGTFMQTRKIQNQCVMFDKTKLNGIWYECKRSSQSS